MRGIAQFVLVVAFAGLVGCGGGSQNLPLGNHTREVPGGIFAPADTPIQFVQEFPNALPQDNVQPWEELGADGNILVNHNKGVSATNGSSEFYSGPQTYLESGDTSDWNGALRMASGVVGDANLSYAMYRIPLGGSEPGVVSVDANLRPMGDGNFGGYWVGLADYGNNSWQWFGPVTEAHWRVSTVQEGGGTASYTSGVGSVFVCVLAHDGAVVDIVGVGIDSVDPADTDAPPIPSAPVLTPVAGGLLVDWTPFAGEGIAGYKVYYTDYPYTHLTAFSANTLVTLHDSLVRLDFDNEAPRKWWVAISSVDHSGNESATSMAVGARPLPSDPSALPVWIEVDTVAAVINQPIGMVATGADTYDWDLNGDGTFDIVGDTTGMQDIDTSRAGIIRPLVKGTGGDGTSVALSAVSVVVSGSSRPVAVANATPASGDAPLPVVFSGTQSTDFDGSIVGGGWDFDGDGIYDVWDDTNLVYVNIAGNTYSTPGLYNAKLRVVDNDGAWDVDTVTIFVTGGGSGNAPPTADLTADVTIGFAPFAVAFDAGGSTDGDGSIVRYWWDFDGDNRYDGFTETPVTSYVYVSSGSPEVHVSVEDNDGARTTATLTITVNVPGNQLPVADVAATPDTGDLPLTIGFDAQGSSDPDGIIVRYDWDFDGDGNFELYGGGDTPGWTYTTPGVFDARVRVTDDAGTQDVASVQVTVNVPGNDSPTADLSVTPAFGDEGVTVTLDASASNDTDGSIVDYEWDFNGDGLYDSYGNADIVTHVFNNHGVFNSKVRVTDDSGAQSTATAEVRVNELFNPGLPWPTFRNNNRHTGRSPYTGAQANTVKWSFLTGNWVDSSPAIGADGTVYVGSVDNKLYAFNPDGSLKWSYTTGGEVWSSPAIGADGTVYFGSEDNKLYAIDANGNFRWSYTAGDWVDSSPVIGADGTVYFGSYDTKLYALNPDGSLKWEFTTGDYVVSSPAIGADGTVYVGSYDDKLYAINADGTEKWSYTTGGDVNSSPALDADGTVYVGSNDNKLYALNPDGTEKWSFTTGNMVESSPAIGADGTVYVGCNDFKLYAINADGSEKWSYTAGDKLYSSPAIGADGTVYVGCDDTNFYAINPDGTVKWSYTTTDWVGSSPAIGADGTVYVGCWDGELYAFGNNNGNTTPVAVLQGSPLTGDDSIDVGFSAADSFDPDGTIDDYEWDFDGDGTYNETGAEADNRGEAAPALQTYTSGPSVVVYVRVTDNDGAADTASITIRVHGWATVMAIDLGAPTASAYCESSLVLVGGMPAIGSYDFDNGRLLYVRALDPLGAGWPGAPIEADSGSGDNVGSTPSLAVVNGNPAIGYYNSTDSDLMYVRASDAVGDTWGTPETPDATGTTGLYPALLVVDGNPAIGYCFDNQAAMYVRASDASGTSWGTPLTVDSVGVVGQFLSMALVDGWPAISSRYWTGGNTNVRYSRASDASGSTWDSPIDVNAQNSGANYTSIAVIDGNPAIAYQAATNGLMYVRATDPQGSVWGTPVTVVNSSDAGLFNSLVSVNGKPAICSSGNGNLVYIEALDSVGSSWDASVTTIGTGDRGSMIELNGKPAISYNDFNFPTSNEIKYAYRY